MATVFVLAVFFDSGEGDIVKVWSVVPDDQVIKQVVLDWLDTECNVGQNHGDSVLEVDITRSVDLDHVQIIAENEETDPTFFRLKQMEVE